MEPDLTFMMGYKNITGRIWKNLGSELRRKKGCLNQDE